MDVDRALEVRSDDAVVVGVDAAAAAGGTVAIPRDNRPPFRHDPPPAAMEDSEKTFATRKAMVGRRRA